MKKIISLALVLILLLSFCSCEKEESATSASPDSLVENNKPETNEPEVQKPEMQESKEPKEPESHEMKYDILNDKFDPDKLSENNIFSEYEIVIALTDEETAKEKTYTPEDFPDLDVYYAYEYTQNISYPEYKDKTILFLYLKQPSKQNVLNAVSKAKTDSRIYDACPSVERSFNPYNITAIIHDDNDREYSVNDFLTVDNIKSVKQQEFFDSKHYIDIETKDKSVKSTIATILKLKEINNIEYIAPVYENYFANEVSVILTKQESAKDKTYTAEDFPYISGFDVKEILSYFPENKDSVVILVLKFSNTSLLYCADAVAKLNSDERISLAHLNPLGKLTND